MPDDDFIYQLNTRPSPVFAARLKSTLDRQKTRRRYALVGCVAVLASGVAVAMSMPEVLHWLRANSVHAESSATTTPTAPPEPREARVAPPAPAAAPIAQSAPLETPAVPVDASSRPNMTCKPLHPKQGLVPPVEWTDCVGTYTYGDGNVYRGEFRHGSREGLGVLEIKYIGQSSNITIGWDGPATYVGSFKDHRLNGYGLLIAKTGAAYAGTFKDNIAQSDLTQKQCSGEASADWTNCIGTYRFPSGNVYRGEFVHGLPEGIGALEINAVGSPADEQVTLPSPGVYVGQFREGKFNGQGAVVMSGDGYFGRFRDNMPDNKPSPGTEASLRRFITSWEEKGRPNYDDMEPGLAEAAREQAPQTAQIIQQLGAFESLKFVRVNPIGMDIYLGTFAHGEAEFTIAPLDSNGKAVERSWRVLP